MLAQRTLQTIDVYRQAKQVAARALREAKIRVWEEFGEAMKKDYRSALKRFWHLRRGKQFSANTLYSAGRDLLTCTENIVGRWKEHFEELLNSIVTPFTEEVETGDSEENSAITLAKVSHVVIELFGGRVSEVDKIRPVAGYRRWTRSSLSTSSLWML